MNGRRAGAWIAIGLWALLGCSSNAPTTPDAANEIEPAVAGRGDGGAGDIPPGGAGASAGSAPANDGGLSSGGSASSGAGRGGTGGTHTGGTDTGGTDTGGATVSQTNGGEAGAADASGGGSGFTSCSDANAECGTIVAVDGSELDCGDCERPTRCGGLGIPRRCGDPLEQGLDALLDGGPSDFNHDGVAELFTTPVDSTTRTVVIPGETLDLYVITWSDDGSQHIEGDRNEDGAVDYLEDIVDDGLVFERRIQEDYDYDGAFDRRSWQSAAQADDAYHYLEESWLSAGGGAPAWTQTADYMISKWSQAGSTSDCNGLKDFPTKNPAAVWRSSKLGTSTGVSLSLAAGDGGCTAEESDRILAALDRVLGNASTASEAPADCMQRLDPLLGFELAVVLDSTDVRIACGNRCPQLAGVHRGTNSAGHQISLKLSSNADLDNVLLHELIHAAGRSGVEHHNDGDNGTDEVYACARFCSHASGSSPGQAEVDCFHCAKSPTAKGECCGDDLQSCSDGCCANACQPSGRCCPDQEQFCNGLCSALTGDSKCGACNVHCDTNECMHCETDAEGKSICASQCSATTHCDGHDGCVQCGPGETWDAANKKCNCLPAQKWDAGKQTCVDVCGYCQTFVAGDNQGFACIDDCKACEQCTGIDYDTHEFFCEPAPSPTACDKNCFEGMRVTIGPGSVFAGTTMTLTQVRPGPGTGTDGYDGAPARPYVGDLLDTLPVDAAKFQLFQWSDGVSNSGTPGFPTSINNNFINRYGHANLLAIWQDGAGVWQWAYTISGGAYKISDVASLLRQYLFTYDSRQAIKSSFEVWGSTDDGGSFNLLSRINDGSITLTATRAAAGNCTAFPDSSIR